MFTNGNVTRVTQVTFEKYTFTLWPYLSTPSNKKPEPLLMGSEFQNLKTGHYGHNNAFSFSHDYENTKENITFMTFICEFQIRYYTHD